MSLEGNESMSHGLIRHSCDLSFFAVVLPACRFRGISVPVSHGLKAHRLCILRWTWRLAEVNVWIQVACTAFEALSHSFRLSKYIKTHTPLTFKTLVNKQVYSIRL